MFERIWVISSKIESNQVKSTFCSRWWKSRFLWFFWFWVKFFDRILRIFSSNFGRRSKIWARTRAPPREKVRIHRFFENFFFPKIAIFWGVFLNKNNRKRLFFRSRRNHDGSGNLDFSREVLEELSNMLFSWWERTRLNQGMWDFSGVCIFIFLLYSKVL